MLAPGTAKRCEPGQVSAWFIALVPHIRATYTWSLVLNPLASVSVLMGRAMVSFATLTKPYTISSMLLVVPVSDLICSANASNCRCDAEGSRAWSSLGPKHFGKLEQVSWGLLVAWADPMVGFRRTTWVQAGRGRDCHRSEQGVLLFDNMPGQDVPLPTRDRRGTDHSCTSSSFLRPLRPAADQRLLECPCLLSETSRTYRVDIQLRHVDRDARGGSLGDGLVPPCETGYVCARPAHVEADNRSLFFGVPARERVADDAASRPRENTLQAGKVLLGSAPLATVNGRSHAYSP